MDHHCPQCSRRSFPVWLNMLRQQSMASTEEAFLEERCPEATLTGPSKIAWVQRIPWGSHIHFRCYHREIRGPGCPTPHANSLISWQSQIHKGNLCRFLNILLWCLHQVPSQDSRNRENSFVVVLHTIVFLCVIEWKRITLWDVRTIIKPLGLISIIFTLLTF